MCEKVNRLLAQFKEAGTESARSVASGLAKILRDNFNKIDVNGLLGTSSLFDSRDNVNSARLMPVVANMSEGHRASVVAELGRRLG